MKRLRKKIIGLIILKYWMFMVHSNLLKVGGHSELYTTNFCRRVT